MNDEYTVLKGDLEQIEAMIMSLRSSIPPLIERYERSDHPLKRENIARLRTLFGEITGE